MHVILSARHCDLTDELRELVQHRFDGLERFEPRASRAEVMITAERVDYTVEALISVDGGARVHARADGTDARTAIDRVAEKLARQLRRRHGRRRDHQAPPLGALGGEPEGELADEDLSPEADDDAQPDEPEAGREPEARREPGADKPATGGGEPTTDDFEPSRADP